MKIKKKKGSKQLTKENTHVVPNKKRVREKAKQSEEKSINSAFTSTIPLHFILRTRKQGPLWDVKAKDFSPQAQVSFRYILLGAKHIPSST